MPHPLESGVGRHQYLAPPHLDGPVGTGAVAGSVEGEADDRARTVEAVFGHDRCDVRVVVLDLDPTGPSLFEGQPVGAVAGMTVDGVDPGLNPVDAAERRPDVLHRLLRLEGAEVAYVLTDPRPGPRGHADRGLEFAAEGHGRLHRDR